MKQLKIFTSALVATCMILFFSSCNQGNEKKASDATPTTDTGTSKPTSIMFIKHRVADFDKWLPVYDADDSMRLAYGLHNYGVSRGIDDSNMVFVALKIDDLSKAKAFAALPNLKTAMQKAGVVGEPTILYYDRQMFDLTTTRYLNRVMVSHKVKDWDKWKKEFESHKQARLDAGLRDRSFGYEAGDNKMVYVIATVDDLKKAKDFFASKDLQDKMQTAGVDGPPTIFFYKLVKKY